MDTVAEPTRAQRFAAHEVRRVADPGSRLEIALREAAYWDSFPHCYTREQVSAGRALIVDVTRANVRAVMSLRNDVFEEGE